MTEEQIIPCKICGNVPDISFATFDDGEQYLGEMYEMQCIHESEDDRVLSILYASGTTRSEAIKEWNKLNGIPEWLEKAIYNKLKEEKRSKINPFSLGFFTALRWTLVLRPPVEQEARS